MRPSAAQCLDCERRRATFQIRLAICPGDSMCTPPFGWPLRLRKPVPEKPAPDVSHPGEGTEQVRGAPPPSPPGERAEDDGPGAMLDGEPAANHVTSLPAPPPSAGIETPDGEAVASPPGEAVPASSAPVCPPFDPNRPADDTLETAQDPPGGEDPVEGAFSSLETTQVRHESAPPAVLESWDEETRGESDRAAGVGARASPLVPRGQKSLLEEQGLGFDEKTGRLDASLVQEVLSEAGGWGEDSEAADSAFTRQPAMQPATDSGDEATPVSSLRGTFCLDEDGRPGADTGDQPPVDTPARASTGDGGGGTAEHLSPGDTLFEYAPVPRPTTQAPDEDIAMVEALSAEWDLEEMGFYRDGEPDTGGDTAEDTFEREVGTATSPAPREDGDAGGAGLLAGRNAGENRDAVNLDGQTDSVAGEAGVVEGPVAVPDSDGTPPGSVRTDVTPWSQESTGAWSDSQPSRRLDGPRGRDSRRAVPPPAPGETIAVAHGLEDRYRVQAPLGRGGAGVVTEVHDQQLDRPVALKMARTDLSFATPEEAETWLQRTEAALTYEARLTARLEDPRIVPVHDLGRTRDGRVFFSMKRVRGVSLSDIVARMARGDEALLAEYSLNRRLTLFVQMCLGMAFAHDHGVIHRDLKPGNIMVGEYGTIQIIDWGLARFLDPSSDAPMLPDAIRERDRRVIQGTPGYMAPEQALGDHDAIDRRTDIYALGAILYELLTFRSPIETTRGGESLRTRLYQLALGRFPPPSEAVPGLFVPPELDAICLKALAGEKADRFQDARSLAREVESYLEGTRLKEEADRLAERGRLLSEEYRALQGALQEARRAARLARERTPRWAPVQEKEMLWALEDNEAEIARRRTTTFADAVRAFHEALGYDRESTEARNGLAEIYWTRVVEMEEEGQVEEARYYEREARQYDTGSLTAQLDGHGKLILSSTPARMEVELLRFVEVQRRLVPRFVSNLGRTPLEHAGLPMGSYLLVLHRLGIPDILYPIWVRRSQTWEGHVTVPEETESPEWVFVPAAPCIVGGDPKAPGSIERTEVEVSSFYISRLPVSCGEYCEFLNMLSREEAQHRVPRRQDGTRWATPCWWRDNDGRYFVPRRDRDGQHWHKDLAVTCVSWDDAQAFARWKSTQDGAAVRLPTENEWEKAARGVDGRFFPWGNHFDPAFCKMSESRPGVSQPEVIGTFPLDESPYGVRDMAGGMSEWANGFFDDQNLLMTVRGGGWNRSAEYCRAAARSGSPPRAPNPHVTFRLVKEC